MITQRQAIRPRIQQKFGMRARKPHAAGCVFAVDHDEVELPIVAQTAQIFRDGTAPRAAHHIAKKQYFHGFNGYADTVRTASQTCGLTAARDINDALFGHNQIQRLVRRL